MFYKRKVSLILVAAFLAAIFMCGCSQPTDEGEEVKVEENTFSIHFIDVGQGDCIFARFSDGKTMLVDCGPNDENIANKIIKFIKGANVDTIDYFVLTHPDGDHVGNAVKIMSSFNIGTAYLPDIYEGHFNLYSHYKAAEFYIRNNNISVNRSDCYDIIQGSDYNVVFLAPQPKAINGSAYRDFNSAQTPTDTQANALSSVIYIEAQGVRCLLTGDLTSTQEIKMLNSLQMLKFHHDYYNISVDLNNIDFLKVAHHGADSSSCDEFLMQIRPINAIISVGGNNFYGHPSTQVLNRLYLVNPLINVYRTDVSGTIAVTALGEGKYKVKTVA